MHVSSGYLSRFIIRLIPLINIYIYIYVEGRRGKCRKRAFKLVYRRINNSLRAIINGKIIVARPDPDCNSGKIDSNIV